MDDKEICGNPIGLQTALHRPLGLYPDEARPIEARSRPSALADPALARHARFVFAFPGWLSQSVHFASHNLDAQLPSKRRFASFGDTISPGVGQIAQGQKARALAYPASSRALAAIERAEGWIAIPLGRFEGPTSEHEAPAAAMAVDRLAWSLCAPPASDAARPGPRR